MRLLALPGSVLCPLVLALACTGSSEKGEEPCPPGSHREEDGLCHLDEDTGTTGEDGGGPGDGGSEEQPLDLAPGDPITTLGTATGDFYEHVDAEVIDQDWAILVGQGGFSIASMADGHIDGQYATDRGYYVGMADGIAWVGTKYGGLYEVDLSDPTAPVQGRRQPPGVADAAHQDLDFNGELIAVSWLDQGVQLLSHADLTDVAWVSASEARGLALGEGMLLYCDEEGDEAWLVLVDLSQPSSPVELDRVALPARGHDVSVQGERVAVALGGNGVAVFERQGDVLVERGQVNLPGTTTGVALDGDYLWTSSWEVAGLVWVGEGNTPVAIGHEEVTESAMGIGAGFGRAMVADWFYTTALQAEEGLAGPELVVDDTLYIDGDAGAGSVYRLELWNNGAFDLELALEVSAGDFALDTTAATLESGQRLGVLVEQTSSNPDGAVAITSNDPDEASVTVEIRGSATGIGQPHVDATLQGFTWPDGALSNYRISDFEGEVLFLAYWAEF